MQDQDKNIKEWTAADFDRYHRGEMPAAEMHSLEMQALEDPFLQDEMDGYRHTDKSVEDVENLQIKINNSKSKTKIVWFKRESFTRIAGVAAVFIILTGIGWYLYQQKYETGLGSTPLASVQKENLNAPENSIDSVIDKVMSPVHTVVEQKPEIQKAIVKNSAHSEGKNTNNLKPVIANDKKINDDAVGSVTETHKDVMAEKSIEKAEDAGQVTSEEKPYLKKTIPVGRSAEGNVVGVNAANFIKGNVIDQQGKPVANAIIINDKNKTGVQTDAQGKFVYAIPDSTTQVKVSALGYTTALKDLNAKNVNNDIILQRQDEALSEVVVTANAAKRKKNEVSTRSVSSQMINEIKPRAVLLNNVFFTGNLESYNTYIKDSMKLSAQADFNKKTNKTILHFDTDENGNALRIKVLRSYCTACNAAAIRLLERAPGWQKIKIRKPAEIIITY